MTLGLENEMEYTKSDGLILVSLFGADQGSGATLSGTIAYAEMLTQSVPSAAELSQAFTRFMRAGILGIDSGRYILTEDIRADLKTAFGKEGKWAELAGKAVTVLQARRDVPVNSEAVTLTEAEVAAAWDEFRKELACRI